MWQYVDVSYTAFSIGFFAVVVLLVLYMAYYAGLIVLRGGSWNSWSFLKLECQLQIIGPILKK